LACVLYCHTFLKNSIFFNDSIKLFLVWQKFLFESRISQAENKTLSTVNMLCKPTKFCSAMQYSWSQTPNISLLYEGVWFRNCNGNGNVIRIRW
jgi:hypothetical protein